MAADYTFISSEQITVLLPPNSTRVDQQVTAQATISGIVFLAQFPPTMYSQPAEVADYLNALALGFNGFAGTPGVDGISAVQVIDSQNQLQDKIDVTVVSSSGHSSTVIRTNYPTVDFPGIAHEAFVAAVDKARAQLDAVENE